MDPTDLDGHVLGPCVLRSFARSPVLSHFGETTSLAYNICRWSTLDGWGGSRTWRCIRPASDTRLSSPHTPRLWGCSSRNWCCRSGLGRRWRRGHSRPAENTTRSPPHTPSSSRWASVDLGHKARLQQHHSLF